MPFKKLLPYALAACSALMLPLAGAAQTSKTLRVAARAIERPGPFVIPDEPVLISAASPEDITGTKPLITKTGGSLQIQQLITAAIDERLGSHYRWGGTGPGAFDCSGFVWSTFQSAGIDFERGSARTLWARFTAPAAEEQYKFGTLVFFSNLAHVGIVADEHGFYHASRHHGVVYSPFNDYWLSRIDGFRKVPVPMPLTTD